MTGTNRRRLLVVASSTALISMSAVYSEASKLLQHYLDRQAGLKTLLYGENNGDTPSHKKQYKLVAETLRCQQPHSQHPLGRAA